MQLQLAFGGTKLTFVFLHGFCLSGCLYAVHNGCGVFSVFFTIVDDFAH